MSPNTTQKPLIKIIIEKCCAYYDISEEELLKKNRDEDFIHKKKIIIYLLRKEYYFSLKEISKNMGYKNLTYLYDVAEDVDAKSKVTIKVSHDIRNLKDILSTLV